MIIHDWLTLTEVGDCSSTIVRAQCPSLTRFRVVHSFSLVPVAFSPYARLAYRYPMLGSSIIEPGNRSIG